MACGRRAPQREHVKHGQHSCSVPWVLSGDLGVCGGHPRHPAAIQAQHYLLRSQLHHSQQFHDGAVETRVEQHKPLSDRRSRAGMDASLTSEEESQSGFSFKVINVFLSDFGASWCPPAWPWADSEGYKEYVFHPGLIGEVAAAAVRRHLFSLHCFVLPGHSCLDYQRLL